MRFGHLRGVLFAVVLVGSTTAVRSAFADGFHNTIPREVLARDLSTGEPYFAPPVPWGHYAKDGLFDHFSKKPCGICGLLAGKGAGFCHGHGLLGHGGKGCGKKGCGHCGKGGEGLFHHGNGCGDPGCGLFGGGGCGLAGCGGGGGCGLGGGGGHRIKNCGLCSGKGCGLCRSSVIADPGQLMASEQASPVRMVVTSPQTVPMASGQDCGQAGCKLGKGHHHGRSMSGDPCGGCGGKGCGLCGGNGEFVGDPCGGCGGKGCGLCAGLGRLLHHGNGCGACGGKGCGLCGGFGKKCGNCGGKGCGLCSGLKSKLSGLLHPHKGDIKYFVGPGGPVPLTPGYVPYVNPVRSPRDFLAFPPYTPDGF